MKYCSICLQPDTRPNTTFSSSGICPSCIYFSEIGKVDWDERYETLVNLLNSVKSKIDEVFQQAIHYALVPRLVTKNNKKKCNIL